MNLDAIGYRYLSEELAVLMSLQGYEHIPALPAIRKPTAEEFSRGLSSLEEAGFLENIGGKVLLDDVQAMIIRSLCTCGDFMNAGGGASRIALCHCPHLKLLVHTEDAEHWIVEVGQESDPFEEEYQRLIQKLPSDGTE